MTKDQIIAFISSRLRDRIFSFYNSSIESRREINQQTVRELSDILAIISAPEDTYYEMRRGIEDRPLRSSATVREPRYDGYGGLIQSPEDSQQTYTNTVPLSSLGGASMQSMGQTTNG